MNQFIVSLRPETEFFCCFHVYRSYVSVIIEDVIQLDSEEDDNHASDPFKVTKAFTLHLFSKKDENTFCHNQIHVIGHLHDGFILLLRPERQNPFRFSFHILIRLSQWGLDNKSPIVNGLLLLNVWILRAYRVTAIRFARPFGAALDSSEVTSACDIIFKLAF